MNIGLIDVDGHNFPNLPLMKISAHHKQQGDQVEWCNPFLKYDQVYMSKVFDFTPGFDTCLKADEIIKGGTAYGLDNKLPDKIESICPDYSLYNNKEIAYGFLTRGCPNNCGFCIVTKKEGKVSRQVADLNQFWNGQKLIKLLDPNLLACEDNIYLLKQLRDSKVKIDFTQGLDVRLLNDDIVNILNDIRVEIIHFAWDNYEFNTYKKLKEFRNKFKYKKRKLAVYVLTNFNTTHEQDLERIYKLKELEYEPYVMIYDKYNAPRETRLLQRWVNNKIIFGSCERFEAYNYKLG